MKDVTDPVSEVIRVFMAEQLAPSEKLLEELRELIAQGKVDWDQVDEEVLAAGDRLAEGLLGELQHKLEIDEDET